MFTKTFILFKKPEYCLENFTMFSKTSILFRKTLILQEKSKFCLENSTMFRKTKFCLENLNFLLKVSLCQDLLDITVGGILWNTTTQGEYNSLKGPSCQIRSAESGTIGKAFLAHQSQYVLKKCRIFILNFKTYFQVLSCFLLNLSNLSN